jgi:hypothetical protein
MPSLDDLGTKQMISGTPDPEDLIPFFDLSEFGNDKVKKTTVSALLGAHAHVSADITDASAGPASDVVVLYGPVGQVSVVDKVEFIHSLGTSTVTAASDSNSWTWNTPNASGTLALSPVVVAATPSTGFTITAARYTDQTHYLTPIGLLASGTFNLPTPANSRVGQIIRVISTQIVSAITIGNGTIIQPSVLTGLAANTTYSYQCVNAAAGIWTRLQ